MGRNGSAHQSISAPCPMLYFSTSWLMSTISASGAIPRTTARQIAGDGSRSPQSDVRLTKGRFVSCGSRAAAGVVTTLVNRRAMRADGMRNAVLRPRARYRERTMTVARDRGGAKWDRAARYLKIAMILHEHSQGIAVQSI